MKIFNTLTFLLLSFLINTLYGQAASTVQYNTNDNHYGWFQAKNKKGERGFYLGYGNGTSIVNLALDKASQLRISGGNLYVKNEVYTDGWFRTYGSKGLYSQTHGLHFYPINANYWRIRSNRGLEVFGKDNKRKGVLYHNNSNAFGLLDGDGNWGLLMAKDSYTQLRINNVTKLDINNSRTKVVGDLHVTGDVKVESKDGNIPMLVEKGIDIVPVGSIPDYVFKDEYELKSLDDLEDFINSNKHLPGVVGEQDVEENDGKIEIASFTYSLLEKIEELTLYTIQQQKEIDSLKDMIKATQK